MKDLSIHTSAGVCVLLNLPILLTHFLDAEALAVSSVVIKPGTGLVRQRTPTANSNEDSSSSEEEVVIFEHTDMGSGGLVLNRPTPLHLRDLSSAPKFAAFGDLPLMMGCGVDDNKEDGGGEESNRDSLAVGDLTPWFWLHDIDNISGSFVLDGADGPLYMGGNIEELTRKIEQDDVNPMAGHFNFFRRYKSWSGGNLAREIEEGRWLVAPQDPKRALFTSTACT